jgi:hypothetical protein
MHNKIIKSYARIVNFNIYLKCNELEDLATYRYKITKFVSIELSIKPTKFNE